MMHPLEIEKTIREKLPGAEVQVKDLTGTFDHFEALVVAPQFEGLSMVEQHQVVYRALGEAMKEAIHALKLKTYTPAKWESLRQQA